MRACAMHAAERLDIFLAAVSFGFFLEHLCDADDGVQRRAQLMAHIRQEFRLRPVRALRGDFRLPHLQLRALSFDDLAAQLLRPFLDPLLKLVVGAMQLLLRRLLFAFETAARDHVVFEHLDGVGDGADLVLAVFRRDRTGQIVEDEILHAADQRVERPDDPAEREIDRDDQDRHGQEKLTRAEQEPLPDLLAAAVSAQLEPKLAERLLVRFMNDRRDHADRVLARPIRRMRGDDRAGFVAQLGVGEVGIVAEIADEAGGHAKIEIPHRTRQRGALAFAENIRPRCEVAVQIVDVSIQRIAGCGDENEASRQGDQRHKPDLHRLSRPLYPAERGAAHAPSHSFGVRRRNR